MAVGNGFGYRKTTGVAVGAGVDVGSGGGIAIGVAVGNAVGIAGGVAVGNGVGNSMLTGVAVGSGDGITTGVAVGAGVAVGIGSCVGWVCSVLHAASAMVVAIRIVMVAVVSLSINRYPVYLNGDCRVGLSCVLVCYRFVHVLSRAI